MLMRGLGIPTPRTHLLLGPKISTRRLLVRGIRDPLQKQELNSVSLQWIISFQLIQLVYVSSAATSKMLCFTHALELFATEEDRKKEAFCP